MWNEKNYISDRFGLSPHRRNLVDQILSCFEVPSLGVAIVFDNADYEDPSQFWINRAGHLNIKNGGLEYSSAEHLEEIMLSNNYKHLVWLSRGACAGQDLDFAWDFSHELRHLEQDLISFTLSEASYFLSNTLINIEIEEPKIITTIPGELDAELAAWRTICKIFGLEIADSYIQNKINSGIKAEPECFRILKSHDPDTEYDVIGETIKLLRRYQLRLEEFQKTPKIHGNFKNFNQ